MNSRQMQKLSAKARWAKLTPEERSKVMSKVREGSIKKKGKKAKSHAPLH